MNSKRKPETRLSDYFGLKKSQSELDFVDVPTVADLLLFVDPYSFTLDTDPWFVECNNLIVDYFALLVESIRVGKNDQAEQLLSNLHEPEDTHLGFAQTGSPGRGVGRNQANDLLEALTKSKAVQTGALDDLSDCELLIPGISSDKISDVTTNIIRGQLLEYTESQCALLGITTSRVQGGVHWDLTRHSWVNRYANLPLVNGKRVIFIPKACVRFRPAITANEFYNDFVLDFLEAEHLNANDSLVQTLKNGKRKVFKKDLKKRYPFNKEFLFNFTQEHPEVLRSYKDKASQTSNPLRDEAMELAHAESREIDHRKLIAELDAIPTGAQHATAFHNFILGALQAVFYPSLRYPQKEQEIHEGRKRIDITFNNGARDGFFEELRSNYNIFCPFVFFECKNYSSDPANPELDQLAGRFGDKRGKFGIVVCRKVQDKNLMLKRSKDTLHDGRGWIFVLDDDDIKLLLKLRAELKFKEISVFMNEQMRKLLL
jgi:hypothetical protein